MATTRDFAVRITGDSSDANRAVDQFGNKIKKTFDQASIGAQAFKGSFAGSFLGNVGTDIFGRLSTAAADFFGGSTEQASDLNETISAGKAIFGDQAAEMQKWSSTAAQSFGLSQQAALSAATGFGDMFLQLGFTTDAASANSQSIVQMAADLGSFKNLETGDVLDRISGALRGEYDSLQAVIPNINAARVESEALAMTGKKTAAELTAQEKAQATLAIIQKDGSRAAGDFARTQDGAANKSKISTAALQDQQAALGQQLLPAYIGFQSFLVTNVVPAISSIVKWFAENKNVVLALGIGIAAGTAAWGVYTAAVVANAAFTKAQAAANGTLTVTQWAVNAAMSANPIGLIILAIVALVAAIVFLVMNWDTVVKWITQIWGGFIGWITGVIEGFVGWWNGIWAAVGRFIGDVWRNFTLGIRFLWNQFRAWIGGVITGFGNWIRNTWEGIWSTLGNVVRSVWNGILGVVEGGVNGAIDLINKLIMGANVLGGPFGVSIGLIPHVSLPRLATGGITSGPMLALIGDNPGGREVVSPLNRYEAAMDRAYEAGARSSSGGSGGGSRPIYADGIGLIGYLREVAGQEAQLVWADAEAGDIRTHRQGKRRR